MTRARGLRIGVRVIFALSLLQFATERPNKRESWRRSSVLASTGS